MSFYSDASLVMIPSGYKTSKVYCAKPTDGSGDLVFSRSNATATRVGPDGLIEKVRTNVLTYSEDLTNAAWIKDNITISSNAVANPLDGALTADGVISSAVNTYHAATRLSSVISGLVNISIYVKSAAKSNIEIEFTGGQASFNLSAGTINYASGGTATITSVSSGWYRCSVSVTLASAGYVAFIVMPTTGTGEGFAGDGSTIDLYYYGAQIETGDIATPYIATTTAAVSVGPVANVPRLDYLNSTCPKLLLEPQRTNLLQYSEQFNNAYYEKGSVATITANSVISPDGTQNADTLTANGTGQLYVRYNVYLGTAQTCSSSIFAKKANHRYVGLRNSGSVSAHDVFDFDTKTWTNNSGATLSYDELGNGWFRLKSTNTDAVNLNYYWSVIPAVNTSGSENTTASNLSVYIWGGQAEQNAAYATSYIPTLGAAVTRGADVAEKTGISSLIGQTVGTVFVEFEFSGSKDSFWPVMTVMGASSAELIEIYGSAGSNAVGVYMLDGGTAQFSRTIALTVGRHKLAIAYELNNTVAYLDGTVIGGVDTSCTIPTMTQIALGKFAYSSAYTYGDRIDQAILFPVRLSDSDLAALTA
jgi:hypothetical protein